MRADISVDELRDRFLLDENNGALYWRKQTGRCLAGSEAGSVCFRGYRRIRWHGSNILAHRVVFALTNGYWPTLEIDHINNEPTDNRPVNLREATHSQNQGNRKVSRNNMLGIKGVRMNQDGKKYQAIIREKGRSVCLGSFDSAALAHEAYVQAANRVFGQYARAA